MKKKILTLLILAAMLVCLLPTAAFALKPGDALPYSKYCSACGQTALHMYLDGYTKGTYNASSGDYFHIIHAHDDWEHTLDHEQHCFTPRFGDYTIEYAQLSASSGQDPARYHKATCVCGLSLNKEHNYSEYQSGKRSCSDCGYVQTCDHSGNTNPTCLSTTCSVCGHCPQNGTHPCAVQARRARPLGILHQVRFHPQQGAPAHMGQRRRD